MKKNFSKFKDEIDLIELLKIFADEKLKIILILFISILIGFFYNSQKPSTFKNILNIKAAKDTEFTRLLPVYNILYKDLVTPKKNSHRKGNTIETIKNLMFERFLSELLDYEELITILSNSDKVKNDISGLSSKQQKERLYGYTKFLTLNQPNKDKLNYFISFTWPDADEGKYILDNLLKLVSIKLGERIFNELDELILIKEKTQKQQDLLRMEFLIEQSSIAKELGIEFGQGDTVNLQGKNNYNNNDKASNIIPNLSLNINTNDYGTYYLKGFKTINKEIELIKNRQYVEIINLRKNAKYLKSMNYNWVEFNTNNIDMVNLKNSKFPMMISIFIGFCICILYVVISVILKSQKKLRKN